MAVPVGLYVDRDGSPPYLMTYDDYCFMQAKKKCEQTKSPESIAELRAVADRVDKDNKPRLKYPQMSEAMVQLIDGAAKETELRGSAEDKQMAKWMLKMAKGEISGLEGYARILLIDPEKWFKDKPSNEWLKAIGARNADDLKNIPLEECLRRTAQAAIRKANKK